MSISLDEVRHVAKLARLELNDNEILTLQGELNMILGHMTDIGRANISMMEPVSHAVNLSNVWAEDIIDATLARQLVLQNTALTKAGLFVVPAIIEE